MRNQKKPLRIAIIGGGKGTSRLIAGLKHYPVVISAIISTADDGSSSGELRKQFNMVPPGDIRQCLTALSENEKLSHYCAVRFKKGKLFGHPLGNILLALLYEHHGNIQTAIDETCALLDIRGHRVFPATLQPSTLVATFGKKKITGEGAIIHAEHIKHARLSLAPKNIAANREACTALEHADAIVIGPGNLFTSIIPAILPQDIRQTILSSKAKKIYVANLMTQKGHTENFTPSDFVRTIEAYLERPCFDAIFYNTRPIARTFWHKNIGFKPVVATSQELRDARFVPGKFAKPVPQERRGDPIASLRSLVVHDEKAIAEKIFACLKNKTLNPKS